MNMMKKNGGFTLVELIVVIAILAILAGVAVPAYSGYISKAKGATVDTELSAILTACEAANAKAGSISTITVETKTTTTNSGEEENATTTSTTATTVTVTAGAFADSFGSDFKLYYDSKATVGDETDGSITITLSSVIDLDAAGYTRAEWENGSWNKTEK